MHRSMHSKRLLGTANSTTISRHYATVLPRPDTRHQSVQHRTTTAWIKPLLPVVKPDRLFFLLLDQFAVSVQSVEVWSRPMGFPAFVGALLESVLKALVISHLCWASWISLDLPNWTRPVLLARLCPFGWLQVWSTGFRALAGYSLWLLLGPA